MKTLYATFHQCCTLACLALLLSTSAFASYTELQPDNTLSQAEQDSGWLLLFDGTQLDQWRTYGKTEADDAWQVRAGAMVLTRRGGGDLITRESFKDFELHLQWKIAEGGNSGIFFHADESELPIYVHAAEIQILDDARHPDNKQANRRSGSLYDLIAAPATSQLPAGAWNQVVIIVRNRHLQAWQNGVQTVDIDLNGAAFKKLVANSKFADWQGFAQNSNGHIGLQDHGDVVSFKNLKIRRLPSTE
ncbi:MAG: DUF1080 domain-containing protein [bacterium]